MPRCTSDFYPPLDSTETATFSIDFSKQLATAETISSNTWTVLATKNLDPSPANRLVGNPAIQGTVTLQLVGNGAVPGELYLITSSVVTSGGQHIPLYAYCPGKLPQ